MKSTTAAKKTTLHDVAAAVGVTPATVSMVLSGKGNISPATCQLVREAAQRLDYRPNPHAQRLHSGQCSNTIAIFSHQMDLGVATYKLQIVQRLLADQGYEIPAYLYGFCAPAEFDRQVDLLRSLCRQNPRAIVCNIETMNEAGLQELRDYQRTGGIVICFDFPIDLQCDQIIFDREDNTYQATRHLLEIGHREIGFCMPGHPVPEGERLQGFRRALREFGATERAEWLLGSTVTGFRGGLYEDAGIEQARKILQLPQMPTALVVLDDSTAVACAAELERAGLHVPVDISIVGHDDSPIGRCGPLPLTTVVHPAEEIAQGVIQLLQERLQDADRPCRTLTLQGGLIVRKSTAPPRKGRKKR